jgi:hypothetical protein
MNKLGLCNSIFFLRSASSTPPFFLAMSDGRLCARCQAIFSSDVDLLITYDHYNDGSAFIRAAKEGCYICTWAWRRFTWSSTHGSYVDRPVHHTLFNINIFGSGHCTLDIVIYGKETKTFVSEKFEGWQIDSHRM